MVCLALLDPRESHVSPTEKKEATLRGRRLVWCLVPDALSVTYDDRTNYMRRLGKQPRYGGKKPYRRNHMLSSQHQSDLRFASDYLLWLRSKPSPRLISGEGHWFSKGVRGA